MSVCAILLSYKRPQNMDRLIATLRAVDEIDKIILSNNNPDIRIEDWLSDTLDVEVINQPQHAHCYKRFEIALDQPYDRFICPDDDIFLGSDQYRSILERFHQDPDKVHGVRGQVQTFFGGKPVLKSGVSGVDTELDVLNCLYAFSRAHVERYFGLAEEIGITQSAQMVNIDDLLISFSGKGRSRCHDVGPLEFCSTQDDDEIATWRQPGFYDERMKRYLDLVSLALR